MQLGGVIYVLWIVVIAIILLAFLPCVNFFFQLCFDTTTAVAAVATRGRVRATNTSAAGGGQTRLTAGIARGQRRLGAAADRTVNPAAQRAVDQGVALSRRADAALSSAIRRGTGRARSGPAPLRRQDVNVVNVGTGAVAEAQDVQVVLDDAIDERFLSPQQRRALMRARRGLTSAPTGVFRGVADRVVGLARHAVNMGIPSAGPDRSQGHELLADDDDDDDEPQETAPGTESDDEEQRRNAAVASGHGTAYDELARRIAASSSSSVS